MGSIRNACNLEGANLTSGCQLEVPMGVPQKKPLPFAVKQHVRIEDHKGVGDPQSDWNWTPTVSRFSISFDESVASQRTRTNTNGVADVGEYA